MAAIHPTPCGRAVAAAPAIAAAVAAAVASVLLDAKAFVGKGSAKQQGGPA
jgi:hypothetical protein